MDTHKLFCSCPSCLTDSKADLIIEREQRAVASELGKFDRAALHESLRQRRFFYQTYHAHNCLVELDEEPPHPLNPDALEIALQISLLMRAKPIDEVHVMRKTVIDGSNTSGFQRTMLIATDGYIKTTDGKVGIDSICLEEDAARLLAADEKKVAYRLDRLGIPLVELGTAPDIKSPNQAREAANVLGTILRSCQVKRGLGTIRQDLNVSIAKGARIEMKGVQDLDLIPEMVEKEVQRQENLLKIKKELKTRKASVGTSKDISKVLKKSKSKLIKDCTLGVKLKAFSGLIGMELCPGRRLGTELADYAKTQGVKGLLHSDELPAYGITQKEVISISKALKCGLDDGFMLISSDQATAKRAMAKAIERAKQAFKGVPEETRRAKPDGTSEYMRPLPGAARMYPETDELPILVDAKMLRKVKKNLPELIDKKVKRFQKKYKISHPLAKEVVHDGFATLFEKSVNSLGVSATIVANTLASDLPALRRDGVPVNSLDDENLYDVFKAISEGKLAKEAIPDALTAMAREGVPISKALEKVGGSLSSKDLKAIVAKIVKKNRAIIKAQGPRAFAPLMGEVMKEVRGKVDGKLVASALKEALK